MNFWLGNEFKLKVEAHENKLVESGKKVLIIFTLKF